MASTYRQIGMSLLELMKDGLSVRDIRILLSIVDHCCEKDNCLQDSMAYVARKAGVDKSAMSKTVAKLESLDVLKRNVEDIHCKKRIMVNPRMVWSTTRGEDFHFSCNMYDTGSHFSAYEVSKLEKQLVGKVDAKTGELYSEFQHRLGDVLKKYSMEIYDGQ